MSKFRVLSLDGGGVRGLYSLIVLSVLEKKIPFFETFDLFAGTSTGSIVALCLSLGLSPTDILKMYQELAPSIFSPSKNPQAAKYSHESLKEALGQTVFSRDLKLSDLKKKVAIPAFKLCDDHHKKWLPCLYHNFADGELKSALVLDVALASCSAPIYFPSYCHHVDGGVFAPNPSMQAISLAIDQKINLEDIYLLSLGTGELPLSLKQEINWSAESWYSKQENLCDYPLWTLMVDAMIESTHKECKRFLKSRYQRINTVLDEMVEIDEYEKVLKFIEKSLDLSEKDLSLVLKNFLY